MHKWVVYVFSYINYPNNMYQTGNKIKKLRELRNFTQGYMAEKLGISQSNYARLENDEVGISNERLKQIADVLETTKENILSFDEKYVFNVHNEQHSSGAIVHNYSISPEIKQLYEDKIKLLEEKVQMLEKQLSS
ncbi:MAG: helix-turn-helix transcriptional regulator [Bacteroidia bacterium]|nr:helix-turn-helix transcriptional regulator [Bacteroidia bacterium]